MLQLIAFILLSISSTRSLGFSAPPCQPAQDSCDFYLCQEVTSNCGDEGYWLGFGYPFCQKFLEANEQFRPHAQTWLTDVRECLQVHTQELRANSCQSIFDESMHRHVACYVETGFCELPSRDQIQVFWYLRSALWNIKTWQEAHLLNQACRQRNSNFQTL